MAEPADPNGGSLRDAVERFLLAGLGAAALTKERVDELADDISRRGQLTREEAKDAIDDAVHRWRGDALRMTERAGSTATGLVRELGLVTRREWEELELRLAQVEHRLRLVESGRPPSRRPRVVDDTTEITPPDVPPGPGP